MVDEAVSSEVEKFEAIQATRQDDIAMRAHVLIRFLF